MNDDEMGIETLDLALSHLHYWNGQEYLRIGVLEEDAGGPDGTISFCIVQFDKTGKLNDAQAMLTESEIDQVIAGLQEAKQRMAIFRGQTPT